MPRFPHAARQLASQPACLSGCPGMARVLTATLLLVKTNMLDNKIIFIINPSLATKIVLKKVFLLIVSPSMAKKKKRQKGKV